MRKNVSEFRFRFVIAFSLMWTQYTHYVGIIRFKYKSDPFPYCKKINVFKLWGSSFLYFYKITLLYAVYMFSCNNIILHVEMSWVNLWRFWELASHQWLEMVYVSMINGSIAWVLSATKCWFVRAEKNITQANVHSNSTVLCAVWI